MLAVLILSSSINYSILSVLAVYLPYLVKTEYNQAVYLGYLMFAFGLGTTISSAIYMFLGKYLQLNKLLIIFSVLFWLSMVLLGFLHYRFFIIAIIIFCAGLSIGLLGPAETSFIQKRTDEDILGSVLSIFNAIRFIVAPLGILLTGFILSYHTDFYLFLMINIVLGSAIVLYCFFQGNKNNVDNNT